MLGSRTALLLAALLAFPGGAATPQQEQEDPRARFGSVLDVVLHTVVVRVLDSARRPVLGLGPQDFRVTVGDREVPVFAVEWVSASAPASEPPDPSPAHEPLAFTAAEQPAPAAPAGSLVVFFVQADLTPLRISGHLRQRDYNRKLLESLHPSSRIAVVAFDSHLKLWQDWTTDREAVLTAIRRAVRYGGTPPAPPSPDPSTLAHHFDFVAAKEAASPERALELTGRALAAFPGDKVIIFQGWGMGRYGAFGFSLTSEFFRAADAVRAANASVHAVDVTSADGHTLALGLSGIAAATDGLYYSNFEFPSRIGKTLRGVIDGHYELTLDFSGLPEAEGLLDIRLRDKKKGRVLYRPVMLRVVER
jgi:hypothetical protein